ncbi:MAG: oligoribonuclease [Bdellovibrionaceae bacterium]|nr:oligoribonuclease [Pseudobdellovibrionaceae bacterium]
MEKLLWLDMEMTGLDVNKEVPIEIGAIVTTWDLKPLEETHAIIRQPQEYLDRMDDWNKKHHGDSGLTAQVPNGTPPEKVEADLISLIDRHFGKEPAILAGNSIFQDRIFLTKYFPKLTARLHYRMLDVTSWKIAMQAKLGVKFEKKNTHRAVDDIKESIAEFAHYLTFLK